MKDDCGGVLNASQLLERAKEGRVYLAAIGMRQHVGGGLWQMRGDKSG